MRDRALPIWLTAPVLAGGFLALALLERRRPLRRNTEPKLRREVRNGVFSGLAATAAQLADAPVIRAVSIAAKQRDWGLLRRLRLPPAIEVAVACVAMDYAFYLWHILLHRVPLLWRFHLVHHTDLDLDASTAIRFHFGEILLSVPFRAALIAVLGPSERALSTWQLLFGLEVMFHHSEVELPVNWERSLVRFIVTPRMHGIHHSIVREETDSNWSSGLTIWDRLHRTLRLNVSQREITIGVSAFRDPAKLGLPQLTRMPFHSLPDTWKLPDGRRPLRERAPAARLAP